MTDTPNGTITLAQMVATASSSHVQIDIELAQQLEKLSQDLLDETHKDRLAEIIAEIQELTSVASTKHKLVCERLAGEMFHTAHAMAADVYRQQVVFQARLERYVFDHGGDDAGQPKEIWKIHQQRLGPFESMEEAKSRLDEVLQTQRWLSLSAVTADHVIVKVSAGMQAKLHETVLTKTSPRNGHSPFTIIHIDAIRKVDYEKDDCIPEFIFRTLEPSEIALGPSHYISCKKTGRLSDSLSSN